MIELLISSQILFSKVYPRCIEMKYEVIRLKYKELEYLLRFIQIENIF